MKIKHSDIVSHGRQFPSGYWLFTCYALGLGTFRTDAESAGEAFSAALAHFKSTAK